MKTSLLKSSLLKWSVGLLVHSLALGFSVCLAQTVPSLEDLAKTAVVKTVGDYDLVRIPAAEIAQYMLISPLDERLPEHLRGLWWMDGNPAPDKVFSLAGADCSEGGGNFNIDVFGEKIWTWLDTAKGMDLYEKVHGAEMVYKVHVESPTKFTAVPVPHVSAPSLGFGSSFGFSLPMPRSLLAFDANQVPGDENNWDRDSYILGVKVHTYHLRKIVDKDGNPIEGNFSLYLENLKATGTETLLLPVKK